MSRYRVGFWTAYPVRGPRTFRTIARCWTRSRAESWQNAYAARGALDVVILRAGRHRR